VVRALRAVPLPGAIVTRDARKALLYVELYRRRHGHGPTWRELRVALGWTQENGVGYREASARIRALHAYGLRWRSRVERSLNVEPRALEALLRDLRKERVA
jgi:hypothetical protein